MALALREEADQLRDRLKRLPLTLAEKIELVRRIKALETQRRAALEVD